MSASGGGRGEYRPEPVWPEPCRKIALWSSVFVLLGGTAGLLGWFCHAPIMTSILPTFVTMKANTAFGFLMAGSALLCVQYRRNAIARRLMEVCSLTLFLVGFATICEYILGVNLGIDELIIRQPNSILDLSPPGRPSPITALMFMIDAVALVAVMRRSERSVYLAQIGAFVSGCIGLLAIVGYITGAKSLYGAGQYTAIAVNTALCFGASAIGILLIRSDVGLMRTIVSRSRTGHLLRHAIPLAVIAPVLVSWLRLRGEQLGLFGFETGVAIMVTGAVVVGVCIIWMLASQFQQVESALEASRDRLAEQAALLDLTKDCILVKDMQGRVIFWNHGAEQLYKFNEDSAIGKFAHVLLRTEFPQSEEEIIARAQITDYWEAELTNYDADGNRIVVASRWSVKRDESGAPVAILETNNDIRLAKEAEKRVSEFYSVVSHELRTPLTSIRGALILLEAGKAGELSAKAKGLVSIGKKESDRLVRLINDILDLRKIEAGKLELDRQAVEINPIIKQSIGSMITFAQEMDVKITDNLDSERTAWLDQDRIVQVLNNLLSNAIKFSPSGSTVNVMTEVLADNLVRISVIDNGPGINVDDLPKLFKWFQQLDSSDSRAKGGTGLGLAISKSIVEEHGGRIGVDTEVGRGSTFWVELPARAVKQAASQPLPTL